MKPRLLAASCGVTYFAIYNRVPWDSIVKLKSMIVKHLPVLVYGSSTGKVKALSVRNRAEALAVQDCQHITSVYYDTDDFNAYNTRLRREEGAQLFRIRWYGPPQQPASSGVVFVERKTHHEQFTQLDSVKERVEMSVVRVRRFVKGEDVVASYLRHLVEDGAITEDKVSKIRALADDMQPTITTMRPKVGDPSFCCGATAHSSTLPLWCMITTSLCSCARFTAGLRSSATTPTPCAYRWTPRCKCSVRSRTA